MEKLIRIILVLCVLVSCRKNQNIADPEKIVAEWTGKEIAFPSGLQCISIMKDTACIDLYGDNYKILLYADSAGCMSCRTKLNKWKNLINETDTIFNRKPDFLFFFNSKSNEVKNLKLLLRNNYFDYPVFIDKENEIMKLNNIPKEQEYQCFLLDKDNKVVMVGNPVLNPGIWALYKKIINGKSL
jgi:hypothetical protein